MSAKGSILIVDDTPANLDMLVDYLTDSGFKVLVATDGERAIDRLKHARPDLVLLGSPRASSKKWPRLKSSSRKELNSANDSKPCSRSEDSSSSRSEKPGMPSGIV